MLLRLTPRRDDRAALAFDDLASALDAGLMPEQLGGDPAQGDRVLVSLMPGRKVQLEPVDEQALEAAWQSGRGPAALRRLAEQRRQRAGFARDFVTSVRYPATVVLLAAVVSWVGARFGSALLPWTVLGLVALLCVGTVVLVRGLERGSAAWLALPLVGEWARDVGELPYLEILHSLYASGVPLMTAHAQAAVASPVAAVRRRLQQADSLLQQGSTLTEALTQANPVHAETRTLLATGERAGDLEAALERALQRRRHTASRRLATLMLVVRTGAFAFGAAVAFCTVYVFYSGYFGAIRGRH